MTPAVRFVVMAVGGALALGAAALMGAPRPWAAGPASAPPPAPVRTAQGSAITLALHPSVPSAVADWYPASPAVRVPIPPGSVGALVPFPANAGVEPIPAAAHELQATAVYRVPLNELVGAWYARAFRHWGYQSSGTGASYIDWGAVETGQSITFTPRSNPRVNVTVSWLPPNGRTTLVEYFVTDVLVPPRPASSKVPTDIVRVVVRQVVTGAGRLRTVVNRGWIRRLVAAINGLNMEAGYKSGCKEPSGVDLALYPKAGGAIRVSATCGMVTVQGATLSDGAHLVIETMAGALFKRAAASGG